MKFEDVASFRPPFIIAEVGSNWRDLADCLLSIRAAKVAGASAVKFQLFNMNALYGYGTFDYGAMGGPSPHLPPEWLPQLKAEADFYCIEFMCSAFSPELADKVNPLVNIHKVASSEMYHAPLLDRLNTFNKPVIMSTAASTLPDIQLAMSHLKDVEVCLMYCVGAYPAKDTDLRKLRVLEPFAHMVGFSDHSLDIRNIPCLSLRYGAQVIEKHFTAIEGTTPDSGHSLNMKEFKLMVESIKGDPGPGVLGPQPGEEAFITRHKRRLICIKPIAPGETLQRDVNYGCYRSLPDDLHALSGFMVDQVNGLKSLKAIAVGQGIGPGDFCGPI